MPEQLSLDFTAVKRPAIRPLEMIPEAVVARIAFCPNPGCWLWYGARNRDGYGSLRLEQRTISAHVYVRGLLVGSTTDGLELHHTCETKCCVNPEHLEEVSRSEHRKRHPELLRKAQEVAWAVNRSKTHCKQGHPYSGYNLIIRKDRPGYRDCRACGLEAQRKRQRRLAAQKVGGG